MNSSEVRDLLRRAGVRPSKRYGQNFLVDAGVVADIDSTLARCSPETIVEIGPGLGAITEALLRHAADVIAIEADRRLATLLKDRLGERGGLRVCCEDVLTFDFGEALGGRSAYVVGSLPYRITAPILRRIVEHRAAFSGALLITQREVAEKLIASPGKDGSALGVFVNAYGRIDLVRRIGRRSFYPIPEVDSTMWALSFRERPRFSADEKVFFGVVRALYGGRRKMIRRVLRDVLARDVIESVLAEAGVDGTARGETLAFRELDDLARAVEATDARAS